MRVRVWPEGIGVQLCEGAGEYVLKDDEVRMLIDELLRSRAIYERMCSLFPNRSNSFKERDEAYTWLTDK